MNLIAITINDKEKIKEFADGLDCIMAEHGLIKNFNMNVDGEFRQEVYETNNYGGIMVIYKEKGSDFCPEPDGLKKIEAEQIAKADVYIHEIGMNKNLFSSIEKDIKQFIGEFMKHN